MTEPLPVPRAYAMSYGAQKAKWGAVIAGLLGFIAPAAAYLLTVDGNGITITELTHAGLIAVVAAAGMGGAVGGVVYAVENKTTTREIPLSEMEEL